MRVTLGQDGTVVGHDDYYPFGLQMPGRSNNSANADDDQKFTGHFLEQEGDLGIYHAGARMYDPEVPRFYGVDAMRGDMPGWNPYHYTFNNPVRYIDPTGLMPECPNCGELKGQNTQNVSYWVMSRNSSEGLGFQARFKVHASVTVSSYEHATEIEVFALVDQPSNPLNADMEYGGNVQLVSEEGESSKQTFENSTNEQGEIKPINSTSLGSTSFVVNNDLTNLNAIIEVAQAIIRGDYTRTDSFIFNNRTVEIPINLENNDEK